MNFIELTNLDGSKILVNFNEIISVSTKSKSSTALGSATTVLYVMEPYDYIKNIIADTNNKLNKTLYS